MVNRHSQSEFVSDLTNMLVSYFPELHITDSRHQKDDNGERIIFEIYDPDMKLSMQKRVDITGKTHSEIMSTITSDIENADYLEGPDLVRFKHYGDGWDLSQL